MPSSKSSANSDWRSSEWRAAAFRPTTDPAVLWRGQQYEAALAAMRAAVDRQERVLLLTGDVGTGKTILANAVTEALGADNMAVARLLYPSVDAAGLLSGIALACSLPSSFKTRYGFLGQFAPFLSTTLAQGRRTVLVIDEAQCLMDEGLDELAWVVETFNGLSVLLVGQEEIIPRLLQRDTLARNLGTRCELHPLSEGEVREYIAHNLRVAGGEADFFPAPVVREVFRVSGGRPRVINLVCRAVLQMTKTPDAATVRRAFDELAGTPTDAGLAVGDTRKAPAPTGRWRRRWPASVAVALAVGIAGVITLYSLSRAPGDSGAHATPWIPRSAPASPRGEPEAARAETVNAPATEAADAATMVTPPPEPATQPTAAAPSGSPAAPPEASGSPAPAPPARASASTPAPEAVSVMAVTSSPPAPPAPPKRRPKPEEPRPRPAPRAVAPPAADRGADPEAIIDWVLREYTPDRP